MPTIRRKRAYTHLLGEMLEGVKPLFDVKEKQQFSIFLCGANSANERSIRDLVRDRIEKSKSKYVYQVFYPETLFEEVLRSHQPTNLLTLENLLGDSVDLVAIIVESPGTIAELGAFANHPRLKDKMAVFLDAKYKNDRSFINLGPIAFITKDTKSQVFFEDFQPDGFVAVANHIREVVCSRASDHRPALSFRNPVLSILPALCLIAITQPISRSLIEEAIVEDDSESEIAIQVVINYLSTTQLILNNRGEVSLTADGRSYIKNATSGMGINLFIADEVERLRMKYLVKLSKISR